MPDVSVTLDDALFRETAARAIFQSLEPAVRERLVVNAIEGCLRRPESRYGGEQKSALEVAFDKAIKSRLDQFIADEIAARPELLEKIRASISKVVAAFVNRDYDVSWSVMKALHDRVKEKIESEKDNDE